MNDDELGQALGTALAPPAVDAVPDAGARLRSRARKARTERLALGGTVVVVLVLLATIGVVRVTGGGAAAPTRAATASAGFSRLTTPITVALSSPVSATAGSCHAGPLLRCVPPAAVLTVDEVTGLSTAELPERGAIVRVALFAADVNTLNGVGGKSLTAGIGGVSYPATLAGDDSLRIRVETPEVAEAVVDQLGAVRPGPPRTGPGRLTVPVQIWSAAEIGELGPCRVSAAGENVIVADLGYCVVALGPGVSFSQADLSVLPPDDVGSEWRVQVVVDPVDRPALAAYTRDRTGKSVVFVAGGRVLAASGTPRLQAQISTSFELVVDGRAGADALISRLRP